MINQLIDERIGGATEYMEWLRTLIDRGTGIVDANLKLAEAATLLYKQKLRLVFTLAETVCLSGYVKNIQTSRKRQRAFKPLVTDRLLEMRNLVYLDFQSYISGFSYFSRESSPVTISSTKASPNYQADIAVLQRAITRVSDASRSKVMKGIILSTDDKTIFEDNWKKRLIPDQVISFTILIDKIEFLYCTSVRIILIRQHPTSLLSSPFKTPLMVQMQVLDWRLRFWPRCWHEHYCGAYTVRKGRIFSGSDSLCDHQSSQNTIPVHQRWK